MMNDPVGIAITLFFLSALFTVACKWHSDSITKIYRDTTRSMVDINHQFTKDLNKIQSNNVKELISAIDANEVERNIIAHFLFHYMEHNGVDLTEHKDIKTVKRYFLMKEDFERMYWKH